MRTFNATVCAILLATVLMSAKAFAQLENVGVCGHDEEESSQMLMKSREQWYKPLFIEPNPTGMDFKVAVLYFKAANDTFMARGSIYSDSLRCLVEQWDASSAAPSWMGELLIPTAFNASTVESDTAAYPHSITTFFYRMSDGNLWVYGDEIAYTGSPINLATSNAQWRINNGDIHQWFIDNYDLSSLEKKGNDIV